MSGKEKFITVTDDTITASVLKEHLLEGGQYISLGSHRIEKRGIYGGFTVVSVPTKVEDAAA